MNKKRRFKDQIYNGLTYLASSISVLLLLLIILFVVITGKDSLSFDMIKNDYWSENYLVSFSNHASNTFTYDKELSENQYFSEKFGIVFEDTINHEQQKQILVKHLDGESPFLKTSNASTGMNRGEHLAVSLNDQIEKLVLIDSDGVSQKVGMVYKSTALELVDALDSSEEIESLYFKTPGGGIWGSLVATLKLIGLSLLFSLPLGISTAIYLNEISSKGKISSIVESSVDLLAGVPSIIFGLMGVVVLYPITSFFKVEGLSILLGSLTMAIILLPIVIRSVQESLKVVPIGLRMASLSLGANKTQTIFRLVLPSAISGILSAILLAISRIIGESAALIYTMGSFINDSPQISEGATSLAVHIWSIMSQEQPNFELASAISIIILIIVLILNVSVKVVGRRLDRKLGN